MVSSELEIFRMLGEGMRSSDIAKKLYPTPSNVETYRARIKSKMGFKDASELTFAATRWVLDHE